MIVNRMAYIQLYPTPPIIFVLTFFKVFFLYHMREQRSETQLSPSKYTLFLYFVAQLFNFKLLGYN